MGSEADNEEEEEEDLGMDEPTIEDDADFCYEKHTGTEWLRNIRAPP